MRNESIRYLIVPGWQGSPDDHWQSHWQNSLPNSARVEQADWLTPRREDWVAALAEAIAADSTPVILIAHSLGCITVAHWAATAPSQFLRQVRGALLVAPADVERPASCRVTWLDAEGAKHDEQLTGLLATCIQHEMDHLEGILFVDHLSRLKREMVLKKLEKARRGRRAA